jgi:hypothetical protein
LQDETPVEQGKWVQSVARDNLPWKRFGNNL